MEKRDLYDENKQKTGEVIEKGQPIPNGRYYITVVVWMQNSEGKFSSMSASTAYISMFDTIFETFVTLSVLEKSFE